MFIQHVKETPDVGHMLDTKGKDKLAVALANAKSELGKRPVIEHKVVVFQTPEDLLEKCSLWLSQTIGRKATLVFYLFFRSLY